MSISIEIFNLVIQNSPQKIGVWWVARLKFSISFENFNPGGRSWNFSIFGPWGWVYREKTLCKKHQADVSLPNNVQFMVYAWDLARHTEPKIPKTRKIANKNPKEELGLPNPGTPKSSKQSRKSQESSWFGGSQTPLRRDFGGVQGFGPKFLPPCKLYYIESHTFADQGSHKKSFWGTTAKGWCKKQQ